MPKLKYSLHSSKNLFEKNNNTKSKKDLSGGLGKEDDVVKQLWKSEKKFQNDLKYLKNHNKVIFKTAKKKPH